MRIRTVLFISSPHTKIPSTPCRRKRRCFTTCLPSRPKTNYTSRDRVEGVEELMDDLNDYVESIDDDLAELEGRGGSNDDFHFINDDEYEDEFYDDMDSAEDQLHVLGGNANAADEPEVETLAGSICPECMRMFFIGVNDPDDARYECPHCGKKVSPEPLTPENAPIARPVMDAE